DPPKQDPPKQDPPKQDPPKQDPPKQDPPLKTEVSIDVQGVPAGTDVIGPDGKTVLGKAPGKITLPRGDAAVKLLFKAHGYVPKIESIVPKDDQPLVVKLVVAPKHVVKPKCDPHGDIPCFDE